MKPGYFARIILKPQSPLWIPPVSRSQVFPDSLGDPPERRSWAGCRWRWFLVWAAWQSPLASEDSASCLLGQLPSCQGLKLWRKLSKHVGRTGKIRRTQQHRLRRSYCSCFFCISYISRDIQDTPFLPVENVHQPPACASRSFQASEALPPDLQTTSGLFHLRQFKLQPSQAWNGKHQIDQNQFSRFFKYAQYQQSIAWNPSSSKFGSPFPRLSIFHPSSSFFSAKITRTLNLTEEFRDFLRCPYPYM